MSAPAIRAVGREARADILRMMRELQRAELALEADRVPPEDPGVGAHVDAMMDGIDAKGGFALLAEIDGSPAGFLIGVVGESDLYVPEPARRHGTVTDLCVTERARRRGVARALLAEAETRFAAMGLRRMFIGALAGNAAANALYAGWADGAYATLYRRRIGPDAPGREADGPGDEDASL